MKEKSKAGKEKTVIILGLVIVCLFLIFNTYRQKQFRANLNEIKNIESTSVPIENLGDGEYTGKIATSFMALELKVVIENHHYKGIELVRVSDDRDASIQQYIDDFLLKEKPTVPQDNDQMLEYLVFLRCLDNLELADSN